MTNVNNDEQSGGEGVLRRRLDVEIRGGGTGSSTDQRVDNRVGGEGGSENQRNNQCGGTGVSTTGSMTLRLGGTGTVRASRLTHRQIKTGMGISRTSTCKGR